MSPTTAASKVSRGIPASPRPPFLQLCRASTLFTFAATLALMLCLPHVVAQTGGTGTIEGRVQNGLTGKFLNNARITAVGTGTVVFSDESGRYRVTNLPSGPAKIEVFYTALDRQEIVVDVVGGQTVTRDVLLTNAGRAGAETEIIRIDPFVVTSIKEVDGATIAINEQRFAPNIKTVASAEAHGEVMGGNVGQFLKSLPGITEDSSDFEPRGVSIRGLPSANTAINNDGAPSANGVSGRSFTFDQLSLNNVARVEVTKVPTPADPSDTIGGSVNMISKSAFERSGAQFRYNWSFTGNGELLTLRRQPDPSQRYVSRIHPGFNFDFTIPFSKNFGIVLTGLHYRAYIMQDFANKTYAVSGTGTGATLGKPYLQSFQLQDSPLTRVRQSGSLRADWRISSKSVLSAGYQISYFDQMAANYNFNANVGNNAAPTITGGTPFSYGDDFTVGATGRGSIGQTAAMNARDQSLAAMDVRYKYDSGDWKFDALGSKSNAKQWTRSTARGFYSAFTTSAKVPVRVAFRNIDELGSGTTEVFTNTNERFDIYDIRNYNLTDSSNSNDDRGDEILFARANLKRSLRIFSFPLSVQAGGAFKENQRVENDGRVLFTYNGRAGDLSALAFADPIYVGQKLPMISSVERNSGGRTPPYASPFLGWKANNSEPSLFTSTPAQLVTAAVRSINADTFIKETVTAYYAQTEASLLRHRLNVLTGVRFEKTEDYGEGPLSTPQGVWVRNANGTLARTAAGSLIRKPEAGVAGSLQEVPFILSRRAARARKSYDGYYPSLHLTYRITDDLQARLAYAKTYARPNFSNIVPGTTITEDTTGTAGVPGTITVRNTGLRPWTADNYDFALEYYTKAGGSFGVSVFEKRIEDFFASFSKIATAADLADLNLGQEYLGWQVNSQTNAGNARIRGIELSFNQSLEEVGSWARGIRVFANATKLELKGNRGADFTNFLPKTANWGVAYSRKPIILKLNWNWRDQARQSAFTTFGPDGYTYQDDILRLDLSIDVQIAKNTFLYFSGRNIFNAKVKALRYGPDTPGYARSYQTWDFGSTLTAGFKGAF